MAIKKEDEEQAACLGEAAAELQMIQRGGVDSDDKGNGEESDGDEDDNEGDDDDE